MSDFQTCFLLVVNLSSVLSILFFLSVFLGKPADFKVFFGKWNLEGLDFPSLLKMLYYDASVVSRVAFVCTFYRIILCWATRLTKLTVLMTKMPKGGEQ